MWYTTNSVNITIQVVRETVDNQVKFAKVAYPEDVIFNKLVTPAKAKIAFGRELTKAGVKQDLKSRSIPICP